MKKIGIVTFPGSNCDQDALYALRDILKVDTQMVWHQETNLSDFEGIILPGGFSYGDYLRCGAIARFSPVMSAVTKFANDGGRVLGICNGFQILCEAGLLPGALIKNRGLKFVCKFVTLRVETRIDGFTNNCTLGQTLKIPVAHGEGCFVCDDLELKKLRDNNRVTLRYCNPNSELDETSNPNGSLDNIAGVINKAGNVMGLMPHPERACESALGSDDGLHLLESFIS